MTTKHLEECVAHNKHYCVVIVSNSGINEHCFIEVLFQSYMYVYIIYIYGHVYMHVCCGLQSSVCFLLRVSVKMFESH